MAPIKSLYTRNNYNNSNITYDVQGLRIVVFSHIPRVGLHRQNAVIVRAVRIRVYRVTCLPTVSLVEYLLTLVL